MRRRAAEREGFSRTLRLRLTVIALLVTAGFISMTWRLYSVQVLGHERYRRSATDMHTSSEKVYSYRGDILTRDGVILARDVINYEVGIDPTRINAENLHRAVRDTCKILGVPADDRRERLALAMEKKSSENAMGRQWLSLGRRVEQDEKREIERTLSEYLSESELRAIVARPYTRRAYPRGAFVSSVVGVTNREGRGIEGLERMLDPILSSRDGRREVQVGGKMQGQLRAFGLDNAYLAPVSGYNLRSTIDSRVQAIVERSLQWGIKRKGAAVGCCIVMDCLNGDILAMANYPTYDPERFREYPREERDRRRKNLAIENVYEPGSLMKVLIMATAIEYGLVRLDRSVRSYMPSSVSWSGGTSARFGSRTVRDTHPHPDMTVEEALVFSSNIGMSTIGLLLGRDRLIDTFDRFGFGVPTGVALPAERSGKYPPRENWKRFYETVSVSFGYAVTVTPLQQIRAFAALVNGGYLLEPRLIESLEREDEVRRFPERVEVGRVISGATSKRIRELLGQVVERGTSRYLKVEGLPFGAKTGTAYMMEGKRYSTKDYLASFEAVYPVDDPQVVVLCMIEKPRIGSHYGAMVSGPVVVQILRHMYNAAADCQLAKIENWQVPALESGGLE